MHFFGPSYSRGGRSERHIFPAARDVGEKGPCSVATGFKLCHGLCERADRPFVQQGLAARHLLPPVQIVYFVERLCRHNFLTHGLQ